MINGKITYLLLHENSWVLCWNVDVEQRLFVYGGWRRRRRFAKPAFGSGDRRRLRRPERLVQGEPRDARAGAGFEAAIRKRGYLSQAKRWWSVQVIHGCSSPLSSIVFQGTSSGNFNAVLAKSKWGFYLFATPRWSAWLPKCPGTRCFRKIPGTPSCRL